jgi:hypothetical protein
MTKKLRIDIDLPENFDLAKFKLGFTIGLSFGNYHIKLVRNKKPFQEFHDRALQLQASIVEE